MSSTHTPEFEEAIRRIERGVADPSQGPVSHREPGVSLHLDPFELLVGFALFGFFALLLTLS